VVTLNDQNERRVLECFAELLSYPKEGLIEEVRECEALIAAAKAEARLLLNRFRKFVEAAPLSQMEEIYTSTFDLEAACQPYVGYHLLGESYKRSAFLLELSQLYRKKGLAVEKELPDHLGQLLRFLTVCDDACLADELVNEAVLPALEKMFAEDEDSGVSAEESDSAPPASEHSLNSTHSLHPYKWVLQALKRVLEKTPMNETNGLGSMDANE
jgi:nitrate reductase molybdenum cofactor assembly chaperone